MLDFWFSGLFFCKRLIDHVLTKGQSHVCNYSSETVCFEVSIAYIHWIDKNSPLSRLNLLSSMVRSPELERVEKSKIF
jgi:hypothetical protein